MPVTMQSIVWEESYVDIELYFDLEQASYNIIGEDNTDNDGKISGFTPITERKEDPYMKWLTMAVKRKNSSGGNGPFLFPHSSDVFMGVANPTEKQLEQKIEFTMPARPASCQCESREDVDVATPALSTSSGWQSSTTEDIQVDVARPIPYLPHQYNHQPQRWTYRAMVPSSIPPVYPQKQKYWPYDASYNSSYHNPSLSWAYRPPTWTSLTDDQQQYYPR